MKLSNPRYGRYAGLAGVVLLALAAIYLLFLRPTDLSGIAPGRRLTPFALPLALGNLRGDADIATRADQGSAGRVPACAERGAQILNVCQLYERGPVVLALFVNAGGCTRILDELQQLVPAFPGVSFAAVAIEGDRAALRRLVRARGLTLPVGIDGDGAVGSLYKVLSCPQIDFAYPGGVVQSAALLATPSQATLRARVSALVVASRARARGAPAP
jgi:AhpC/TSA family